MGGLGGSGAREEKKPIVELVGWIGVGGAWVLDLLRGEVWGDVVA